MNWEKLHAITKNYKETKFKKEKEEITEKNSNYIHIKKPKSYEMFFFVQTSIMGIFFITMTLFGVFYKTKWMYNGLKSVLSK